MTQEPKKHHYVPECYLSPFTDSKRKFWKREKGNSQCVEVSPAQVGYEIDSNTIRTSNPVLFENLDDKYFIEKEAFKAQENNYGRIINKIIKFATTPIVIKKSNYRLFLETLITIKRRNPATRKALLRAFTDSIKQPEYVEQFKSILLEVTGQTEIPNDIDKYITNYLMNEARDPDRLHDMYLSAFINQTDYTTIASITKDFYSLKQYILHAAIGKQFITSDNPGFTIVGDTVLNLGGFGDTFDFFFPLSPSTCLHINSNHIEEQGKLEKLIYHEIVPDHFVEEINKFTKRTCTKHIFGKNKTILEKV